MKLKQKRKHKNYNNISNHINNAYCLPEKALADGLLTQKQYDKLPSALLDGIIKSKRKGGKAKKPAKDKKPVKKVGNGKGKGGKKK